MIKIGLIGDVHLSFDEQDIQFFNHADYDLLLFVGDLGKFRLGEMLTFSQRLSRLTIPALLLPGNHDAVTSLQMIAEIKRWSWLAELSGWRMEKQVHALQTAVFPVQCVGYSRHPFHINDMSFEIIAARPHAMGGSDLSYAPYLRRQFSIKNLDESAQRLCQLVDQSQSSNLIFLAHNGPLGLGDQPNDIWGCDFAPERGDFGDADLTKAIAHARQSGKRVLAVVAGHMHQYLKQGGERKMQKLKDEIYYLNTARVPRIVERENGRFLHHHWSLTFDAQQIMVKERMIS